MGVNIAEFARDVDGSNGRSTILRLYNTAVAEQTTRVSGTNCSTLLYPTDSVQAVCPLQQFKNWRSGGLALAVVD